MTMVEPNLKLWTGNDGNSPDAGQGSSHKADADAGTDSSSFNGVEGEEDVDDDAYA